MVSLISDKGLVIYGARTMVVKELIASRRGSFTLIMRKASRTDSFHHVVSLTIGYHNPFKMSIP